MFLFRGETMKSCKNSLAQYLVLFSLVLPHPSFAMKSSGIEETKDDLESQSPAPIISPNTLNQLTALDSPQQEQQTHEEERSQLGVFDGIRAALRRIPGFSDGVSSLGSQSSRTEQTREMQEILDDPDIDRTNSYIGFNLNPNGLPGNTLNLGGGMAGLEQPRDHFADDLHARKDHYYQRLYCILDIGEGWLNFMQQACNIGSGALSLYLTTAGLNGSNELPPTILGFNIAGMVISGLLTYAQQRKSTLKDRGYKN